MNYDVIAIGELLIDFSCSKTQGDYPALQAHPGGAPANFLTAIARYGGKTAFISKVGQDAFGQMLKNTLEQEGIDSSGIIMDEDAFTTLAFVTLDQHGDRSFSFARKPGADTRLKVSELDFTMLNQTRCFHFGTLSLTHEPARSATVAAVSYARQQGALITFDPNLRTMLWDDVTHARAAIQWGLAQADIVKISFEELVFLYGEVGSEEGMLRLLKDYPLSLIFLTLGEDGCLGASRKACCRVPGAPGVQAVDTTGAGDIFGGSAIWRFLEMGLAPEQLSVKELEQICTFATAAAGLSTMSSGGISSVPDLAEVLAFLKQS